MRWRRWSRGWRVFVVSSFRLQVCYSSSVESSSVVRLLRRRVPVVYYVVSSRPSSIETPHRFPFAFLLTRTGASATSSSGEKSYSSTFSCLLRVLRRAVTGLATFATGVFAVSGDGLLSVFFLSLRGLKNFFLCEDPPASDFVAPDQRLRVVPSARRGKL